MLKIKKFQLAEAESFQKVEGLLKSRKASSKEVELQVTEIIEQVKKFGDQALVDYTRKFDCPDFKKSNIEVLQKDIHESIKQIPDSDLKIIKEAALNIRNFHLKQKPKSWFETEKNIVLGQISKPVQNAALYIPGGKSGETPLISSILMNVIPAQVAGVPNLCLTSPPNEAGSLNPYTLAIAELLGIEKVYAVGGAWAVAGLAYGTKTLPKAEVIAGPGNAYVAAAKSMLKNEAGTDLIAGPSEITILADSSGNPEFLAADLLSQAEHDILASSILISDCSEILKETEEELKRQLQYLPRKEVAEQSLNNWGALIKTPELDTGLKLVNYIAPEHFELCVEEPWFMLDKLQNAGAVFLGHFTPEPVGDYFAGPNHVLPTNGTAKFSSALNVETFCKKTSLLYANKDYLSEHGQKISRLARLEGLEAHARSIEKRNKI